MYYKFEHDIVDKYEKKKGIINQDIVDYKPDKKYDLIISISTLEHVGWDETPRENYKNGGIQLTPVSQILWE